MRHPQVIASIMLGLIICVMIAGQPAGVQAIREVTPTIPTPTDTTPQAPLTPVGTLDEQIQVAYDTFAEGEYQDVIDMTTAIIDSDPEFSEAYILRGMAYTQLGNANRAIDDYTRAISLIPYEWRVYSFRAEAYAQSGRASEALNDYDTAIDLNPRFAVAYTGRARLLSEQGDLQNAQIDQLIAEGIVRLGRQDWEGAISRFTEAIELDPSERRVAGAYYNRALAYYSLGQYDDSVDDYTAGLELAPNMHDLYLGRGITYVALGETQQAGADFAKRIELLADTITEDELDIGLNTEVEMSYGQVYHFTFEGEAGQNLNILVMDLAVVGVDPLIALLDPDGTAIAGDDDSGGVLDAQISNVELPAAGTYTLVVGHANGGFDGLLSILVTED